MRSRKMANLVIDTIDSNGQPVLPERIKSLVPRLKSYLRGSLPTVVDLEYRSFVVRCDVQESLDHAGYWQLSVTEQDLAARESLHAHAVERSDAWMASPGDMSMDDTMYGLLSQYSLCSVAQRI